MQNAPVSEWAPTPDGPRGGGWTTMCLALLWAAWVLVPGALVLEALQLTVRFLGEQATEAEHAHARSLLVRAGVAAVVVAVLGLGLSLHGSRRGSAIGFGCALVLSVGAALVVAALAAHAAPDEVVPREPIGCQEHSGGPSTCPGG